MALELYGTPRSHFTRVVRVLCHELKLEVRAVDVGNVGDATAFGGNPLMSVPVLVDGDRTLWDSHNICRYLVERQGADPLGVERLDWYGRNVLSVIHGVMSAEVRLLLAERCGMSVEGGVFDKARDTLKQGLSWLDAHLGEAPLPDYPYVCTVALWEHLLFYKNAAASNAPRLAALVERLGERPSLAATRPTLPFR